MAFGPAKHAESTRRSSRNDRPARFLGGNSYRPDILEGSVGAVARKEPDPIRAALEARIEADDLELPFLPSAAMQIYELCQSSEASAAALSSAIHRDPALAGHVLRVANSPAYYPGSPIVSLQQAISRLGQRTISEIVILVSVKGAVFDSPTYRPELEALWKHAAAAGAWAREIARHRRRAVDVALLSGLLQNIGVPVLVKALSTLDRQQHWGLDKETVLAIADEYHAEVGNRLAQRWALPAAVADAIRYHHALADATKHADEARLVALSDDLASILLAGEIEDERTAAHDGFADLNLYPDDVAAILAKAPEIVKFVETVR